VVVGDPFISAMATRGKNGLAILMANFIPDDGMLGEIAAAMLAQKGHTAQELATYGLTGERLRQLEPELRQKGTLNLEGLRLPEPVKRDLTEIAALLRQALARARESVTADVVLRNVPPEFVRYERYLIDATHSNSYAVRSQIQGWLAAAGGAARENTEKALLQQGHSPEELQRLKDIIQSGRVQELKERNDPRLLEVRGLYQNFLNSALDRINDSPQIGLQTVEKRTFSPGAEYREAVQLTPYSVTLIRLTR
ncbi:MAG TPA: hypothetical protein VN203_04360, partial [Candidatus Acidoferrum sp.]|nr:hypothetical protein [Candidatus Acidoferrum sp.]